MSLIFLLFSLAVVLLQCFLSVKRKQSSGLLLPFLLLGVCACIALATIVSYHSFWGADPSVLGSFPLGITIFARISGFFFLFVLCLAVYFVCLFIKKLRHARNGKEELSEVDRNIERLKTQNRVIWSVIALACYTLIFVFSVRPFLSSLHDETKIPDGLIRGKTYTSSFVKADIISQKSNLWLLSNMLLSNVYLIEDIRSDEETFPNQLRVSFFCSMPNRDDFVDFSACLTDSGGNELLLRYIGAERITEDKQFSRLTFEDSDVSFTRDETYTLYMALDDRPNDSVTIVFRIPV